jgi:enoyl-CoA hydratase/3-hydroxyacyl-CoA dehydrogenase
LVVSFEQIRKVAVLGAGTMGHGIAEISAIAGYDVTVRDIEQRFLDNASEKVAWSVRKLAEKGRIGSSAEQVLSRIRYTLSLEEAVSSADIIIEATPEDIDLKRSVFSEVDKFAKPEAILATNTSSLPITEVASVVADRGRVVGLHFFNPPVIMNLIEIIKGAETSSEAMKAAIEFSKKLGKQVVVVQKDIPGFVVNRIMARLMATASLFVELQLATVTQVDAALKYDAGLPMGAFELADYVGLDVLLHVEKAMSQRGFALQLSPLFEEKVRAKEFGVKSGRGFYVYSAAEPKARVPVEEAGKVSPVDLLAPAANEAAWLVSEGIATREDIDVAVVLGLGFPKGLLKMADEWGLDAVASSLRSLQSITGKDWLAPCELISSLEARGDLGVKSGKGFYEYVQKAEERWETILFEKRGPIAYITLNRPDKLNAINPVMLKELSRALTLVEGDVDTRSAVIQGAGRSFCAGFDVATFMARPTPSQVLSMVKDFQALNDRIEALPKPIIASLHGHALGGGFEIALACDFRFASQSADVGQTEINLGFIPGAGGTQRITRLVGPALAKKIIFTGDRIPSSEALKLGLVDQVVDDAKLAEEVHKFASILAEKPPLALAAAKRAINSAAHSIKTGTELEAVSFAMLFSTEDVIEGLTAFFEKRKPQFKGK